MMNHVTNRRNCFPRLFPIGFTPFLKGAADRHTQRHLASIIPYKSQKSKDWQGVEALPVFFPKSFR